jgi:hypothetical protein
MENRKRVMKPINIAKIALTALMLFMAILMLIEHKPYGYVVLVLAFMCFMSIFSKYPSRKR